MDKDKDKDKDKEKAEDIKRVLKDPHMSVSDKRDFILKATGRKGRKTNSMGKGTGSKYLHLGSSNTPVVLALIAWGEDIEHELPYNVDLGRLESKIKNAKSSGLDTVFLTRNEVKTLEWLHHQYGESGHYLDLESEGSYSPGLE